MQKVEFTIRRIRSDCLRTVKLINALNLQTLVIIPIFISANDWDYSICRKIFSQDNYRSCQVSIHFNWNNCSKNCWLPIYKIVWCLSIAVEGNFFLRLKISTGQNKMWNSDEDCIILAGSMSVWMPGWHTGNCFSCLPLPPSFPVPVVCGRHQCLLAFLKQYLANLYYLWRNCYTIASTLEWKILFCVWKSEVNVLNFACHCWHIPSSVNQTSQFTNCPNKNKIDLIEAKNVRADRTHVMHSYFLRPNDEKSMSLWKFFSQY